MIAKEIRRLAEAYTADELAGFMAQITEHEADPAEIEGGDPEEKLTHVLLATRVRLRVDGGEVLKDAFRDEMRAVRGVLQND